jgi:hypothetical protein
VEVPSGKDTSTETVANSRHDLNAVLNEQSVQRARLAPKRVAQQRPNSQPRWTWGEAEEMTSNRLPAGDALPIQAGSRRARTRRTNTCERGMIRCAYRPAQQGTR